MKGMFRRAEPEAAAPVPAAGGLEVVRYDVPGGLPDAELVLRVESGGATYELVALDSDDAADFLVPSELLRDGHTALLADGEEVRGATRRDSPLGVRDACLALHQLLDEQARRIDGLRRDLRRERDRIAGDDAGDAPGPPSREVEQLRERLADAERELDEVDEKRAALAAELAEARSALREERSSGEPSRRVTPGS